MILHFLDYFKLLSEVRFEYTTEDNSIYMLNPTFYRKGGCLYHWIEQIKSTNIEIVLDKYLEYLEKTFDIPVWDELFETALKIMIINRA